jgi:hypothetical protein
VYAKTVKAELDLALSQKKEVVETTTGGKYESEVQKLYEGLDAINIDVRTSLISAYSTLVLRISSSKEPSVQAEAFKKWDETLELVIKESFKIRTINSQLAAARKSTSSGEWEELFTLGREAVQDAEHLKSQVATQ